MVMGVSTVRGKVTRVTVLFRSVSSSSINRTQLRGQLPSMNVRKVQGRCSRSQSHDMRVHGCVCDSTTTATLLYCMSSYVALVSLTASIRSQEQHIHEGMVVASC